MKQILLQVHKINVSRHVMSKNVLLCVLNIPVVLYVTTAHGTVP